MTFVCGVGKQQVSVISRPASLLGPLACALAIVLVGLSPAKAVLPKPLDDLSSHVVRVQIGSSRASGVYIGNRYVLTARHLFDGEGTRLAAVIFPSRSTTAASPWTAEKRVTGRLISAIDSDWDSAVIQLDSKLVPPLPHLYVSRELRPGDVLWVAGYSQGTLQYRHGEFRGFRGLTRHPGEPEWYFEFEAPCYSGDSGGPVFLADGSFVGTMWGSNGPCGCGNESHRTYSVALCAKFTRRLFGALLPRGRVLPRQGQRGGRLNCPDGRCPTPSEPAGPPTRPWDAPTMPWQGPAVPVTPVPEQPVQPQLPAPAPIQSDCDELRILIEANARAIAELATVAKVPGPQGERGPSGPPGSPGALGEKGERGEPGTSATFDPATLTDKQINALAKRLPPFKFQARTPAGESHGPQVEKRLGDTVYLQSTTAK